MSSNNNQNYSQANNEMKRITTNIVNKMNQQNLAGVYQGINEAQELIKCEYHKENQCVQADRHFLSD